MASLTMLLVELFGVRGMLGCSTANPRYRPSSNIKNEAKLWVIARAKHLGKMILGEQRLCNFLPLLCVKATLNFLINGSFASVLILCVCESTVQLNINVWHIAQLTTLFSAGRNVSDYNILVFPAVFIIYPLVLFINVPYGLHQNCLVTQLAFLVICCCL